MNISMAVWAKSIACASILGAMGYLAAGAPGNQDSPTNSNGGAPAPYLIDEGGKTRGSDWPIRWRQTIERENYAAAAAAYRSAQDGPEKEAKRAELKKKLTEIFDADMKARKAQADEIETRLKKLQDQYKSREAAKERIIDLQIEVLEKDAEGLGFPKGESATEPNPYGGGSRNRATPLAEQIQADAPAGRRGSKERLLPLLELMKTQPEMVEKLKKNNLFIVSGDEKLFAYVTVNYPKGPSIVEVREADAGKRLATYQSQEVIAEIRFQEGGVGVRMPEGKFEVRIPLGDELKKTTTSDLPATSNLYRNLAFNRSASTGEFGEYSDLQREYAFAKAVLERAERWSKILEVERKATPGIADQMVRAKYLDIWPEGQPPVELSEAQNAYTDAIRLIDAKIKLLKLDLMAAQATLQVAQSELDKSKAINESKPNAVNVIELQRLSGSAEKAKIQLERAATILELYESILKPKEAPVRR